MQYKASYFYFIIIILFTGNTLDIFRIANSDDYELKYYTDIGFEDHWLVGSIIKSRYHGLYNTYSFTTRFLPISECTGTVTRDCFMYQIHQFQSNEMLYKRGHWDVYKSGLRLPMSIYPLIDALICSFSAEYSDTIWLLELIETFLIIVVFTIILVWIFKMYGFIAFLIALFFILFNPLYNDVVILQSLWVRFFPIALIPFILHFYQREDNHTYYKVGVLVFFVYGLNQSINYELTTVTFMLILTAIIIASQGSSRLRMNLLPTLFISMIAMFLSFVSVLGVHFLLLSNFLKSNSDAKDWFYSKFIERSNPNYFSGSETTEILNSVDPWYVLFHKDLLNTDVLMGFNGYCFIIIYIISIVLGLILMLGKPNTEQSDTKHNLLVNMVAPGLVLTGLSIYYFVFSSHAQGHAHVSKYINYGYTLIALLSASFIFKQATIELKTYATN